MQKTLEISNYANYVGELNFSKLREKFKKAMLTVKLQCFINKLYARLLDRSRFPGILTHDGYRYSPTIQANDAFFIPVCMTYFGALQVQYIQIGKRCYDRLFQLQAFASLNQQTI